MQTYKIDFLTEDESSIESKNHPANSFSDAIAQSGSMYFKPEAAYIKITTPTGETVLFVNPDYKGDASKTLQSKESLIKAQKQIKEKRQKKEGERRAKQQREEEERKKEEQRNKVEVKKALIRNILFNIYHLGLIGCIIGVIVNAVNAYEHQLAGRWGIQG